MPISQIVTNSIANGAVGATQTAATNQFYGFKNRIINGAMVIDQRNAGASVIVASSSYATDRWEAAESLATGGLTAQQVSDAPTGFVSSLRITTSTAGTAGAAENAYLRQFVEGFNCADLNWGTANAQPITISFWAKSSLTGTFSGGLFNAGADRSYVFTYVVNSANTWEYKTVTIAGDTSGTWNTTNGRGIGVVFDLGSGSNQTGTANSWTSSLKWKATGSVSVIGTLSATWQVTGVQLEKGSTATSFDYRPYTTELQLCQRYYEAGGPYQTSWTASGALGAATVIYAVQKRANPTLTISYVSGGGSQPVASATGFTQYSPGSVVGDNARFNFTASIEL